MYRPNRVKPLFTLRIDVRDDNLAHKDYVVAGWDLLDQPTFEIGYRIGKQN